MFSKYQVRLANLLKLKFVFLGLALLVTNKRLECYSKYKIFRLSSFNLNPLYYPRNFNYFLDQQTIVF
jgi:hypothetical protein